MGMEVLVWGLCKLQWNFSSDLFLAAQRSWVTYSVCKEQGHRHFGGRRAQGGRGGNLGERRVFLTEKSVEEGLHDGGSEETKGSE